MADRIALLDWIIVLPEPHEISMLKRASPVRHIFDHRVSHPFAGLFISVTRASKMVREHKRIFQDMRACRRQVTHLLVMLRLIILLSSLTPHLVTTSCGIFIPGISPFLRFHWHARIYQVCILDVQTLSYRKTTFKSHTDFLVAKKCGLDSAFILLIPLTIFVVAFYYPLFYLQLHAVRHVHFLVTQLHCASSFPLVPT